MSCGDALYPLPTVTVPSSPWINWSGTQVVHAESVIRPRSLAELQHALKEVTDRKGRARVVATGLSFSDILQADDTLIEATGLMGEGGSVLLPVERELWRDPDRAEPPLVRVVCGARIRHLNASLACAGLGFENLGGYDGQTLIGAISTSTHGSGIGLPPLCDAVCGLDLVSTGGLFYRIEPTNGLTCLKKFTDRYGPSRTLIQDDTQFWSAVVSLGCMGVIYSVTMKVRAAYRLRERRTMRKWSEVRAALQSDHPPTKNARSYEVLINPYPTRDGDFSCLTTERWLAEPSDTSVPVPKGRTQAINLTFTPHAQSSAQALMAAEPRLIPGILETGLEVLETSTDNIDDSFAIYNVGNVNDADVVSGEYHFPLDNGGYLRGVQAILDVIDANRRIGIFHPTPLALRFVKQSHALLSMDQGEPHATVEMSLWRRQLRAIDALLSYERACMSYGGRPHWGQLHLLTGNKPWFANHYKRHKEWLAVHDKYNALQVFDNHFTDRVLKGVSR